MTLLASDADEMLATGAGYQVGERQVQGEQRPIVICIMPLALELALDEAIKRREKQIEEAAAQRAEAVKQEPVSTPSGGAEGENPADPADQPSEAVRKAEAAAQRAREQEAEIRELGVVRGRNLELGRAIATKGASMTLTRDVAEALCFSVLSHMDTGAAFQSGLRLCLETYQVENDKTRRVSYAFSNKGEARAAGWVWVKGGSTPEELVGRTISLMIASRYADKFAQAESQRVHPRLAHDALPALDRIAAHLVPEPIRVLREQEPTRFESKFAGDIGWTGTYYGQDTGTPEGKLEKKDAAKP